MQKQINLFCLFCITLKNRPNQNLALKIPYPMLLPQPTAWLTGREGIKICFSRAVGRCHHASTGCFFAVSGEAMLLAGCCTSVRLFPHWTGTTTILWVGPSCAWSQDVRGKCALGVPAGMSCFPSSSQMTSSLWLHRQAQQSAMQEAWKILCLSV